MNDSLQLKGSIDLKVVDSNGNIKSTVQKSNLIVTAGKNFLSSWLAAGTHSNAFMPYTAVGTGTASPLSTDTTLQTEIARVANTPSASTNILTLAVTFNPGVATGAVTEAGLFSASSSGTMFSRVTFGVQNVGAGDTLIVNWQVTFS